MDTLWQDVRFGLRALRKNPGFTAVAVLTLALGIGANTAIFSVVNGVLLRPLPFHQPERLVWFWENQPGLSEAPFSAPDFLDYQAQNRSFEQMAAFRSLGFNLTGRGDPERLRANVVSANFFSLLGVTPMLGRALLPEDGLAGARRVAVLSYSLWQRRFGGEASVLGKTVTLNEEPVTVVGVMAADFVPSQDVEFWLNPKRIVPEVFPNFSGDHLTMRGMHYLSVLGRLRPGVSLAQAQNDVDAIVGRLQKQYSSNAGHSVHLVPLQEQASGGARPAILLLMSAVGLVLLIACANVANLLLVRASGRTREMAVRCAMGAGRARLIRQMLTESVLLGMLAGGIGLLLGYAGTYALVSISPEGTPRLHEIRVDGWVLGFSLGISLFTGLLFGLAPAFFASRLGLNESLKEGARSGVLGPKRSRLRASLIASELALSLVLLTGAGLLLRSMERLLEVHPGFNPDNLLTLRLNFSSSKYSQHGRNIAFLRELLPRIERLPGVRAVAIANDLPLEGQDTTGYPTIAGRSSGTPAENEIVVGQHAVNPGYFRAMGIPLLRGREFSDGDGAAGPLVAVVNEAMAKKFWPNEDPIGKRFQLFGDTPTEIVGVVENVRHNGLDAPVSLDAYAPFDQAPWGYVMLAVRTEGRSASLLPELHKEIHQVDGDLPLSEVRTMDAVLAGTIAPRRLTLMLTGVFAAIALVLAALGVFGVMSFVVAQRVHEIGVRMALGAGGREILHLVMSHGLVLLATGLLPGVVASLGLTRLMRSLLFEISPTDPPTLIGVTLLLAAVALAACYVPARRAARVDPIVALRYE
jgi:putative ABC transport system permease protein